MKMTLGTQLYKRIWECEDISLVFNQSLETRGIILLKFMFQIIYEQKFFSSPAFVKTRSDLHQFIFKS